jgi:hypothetical protein
MSGRNRDARPTLLLRATLWASVMLLLFEISKPLTLSSTRLCVTRTFSDVSTQMPESSAPLALLWVMIPLLESVGKMP